MAGNVALPFFGPNPLPWQRPALGTFSTWLNQTDGGDTATATDHTGGLPLIVRGGLDLSNNCHTGILKAAPTPPWTITVALAAFTPCVPGGSGPAALPIILRATDGKLASLWWYPPAGGGPSSMQVYGASDSSINPTLTELDDANACFPFPDYFAWFRAHHDGSAITFSISPEGQIFEELVLPTPVLSYMSDVAKVGFGYFRKAGVDTQFFNSILWNWVET